MTWRPSTSPPPPDTLVLTYHPARGYAIGRRYGERWTYDGAHEHRPTYWRALPGSPGAARRKATR